MVRRTNPHHRAAPGQHRSWRPSEHSDGRQPVQGVEARQHLPGDRRRSGHDRRYSSVRPCPPRSRSTCWRTTFDASCPSCGLCAVGPFVIDSGFVKSGCPRVRDAPTFVNPSGSPGEGWFDAVRPTACGWFVRLWRFVGCGRTHPWAGIMAGPGSLHTLTIAVPPTRRRNPGAGRAGWNASPRPVVTSPHERPQAPPRCGCRRVGHPGMTPAPRSLQPQRTTDRHRLNEGAGRVGHPRNDPGPPVVTQGPGAASPPACQVAARRPTGRHPPNFFPLVRAAPDEVLTPLPPPPLWRCGCSTPEGATPHEHDLP
ncbi:hypothetical protein PSN13_00561 [Micromonospora saelicesensis]|uniref:Uncharacterized protein n=1 Tax=Micromonospora saelicesensis TaxID=285676 RepID=A0A328NUA8_9ACTN|nr:hypothetical protein PSN13_00561 [Micromonospora saelicesensis]